MYVDAREDADEGLIEAMRSVAAKPSVEGLLVLASAESDPDPSTLDPALRELSVPVVGGVFPEVIHEGVRCDRGAVVAGLGVEPRVTTVPGLSDPDREYAEHLDEVPLERGHETAFVVVDAYASRIGEFVTSLFTTYGVELNVLGGGAGSLGDERAPCLFTSEGLVRDAAVVATLDAPSGVGVRHGWQEVEGPFRVTEADGRTMGALDGEPAVDVYRRVIEADGAPAPTEADFFEVATSYPFGISRLDGEKIVRDPYEVGDDGALRCFGQVPENEFVHVLRGDPESLIDAASQAFRAADADADGTVVCFDCISRVLYLDDAFDRELDAVGGANQPAIGALTIGEVANGGEGHLEYYNKTAVAGVVDDT